MTERARIDATIFDALPLARDPAAIRQRVEVMERLLEGMFVIPGIRRRVGLDAILGLVPVFGDIANAGLGAWLVWEARNLGMPRWQVARMAARVGFDTLLGAVPLVGDVADFLYRSNTANLKTVKRHLDRHHPATVTVER